MVYLFDHGDGGGSRGWLGSRGTLDDLSHNGLERSFLYINRSWSSLHSLGNRLHILNPLRNWLNKLRLVHHLLHCLSDRHLSRDWNLYQSLSRDFLLQLVQKHLVNISILELR